MKKLQVYALILKKNRPMLGLVRGDVQEVYLYKRGAELMRNAQFHTIKKCELTIN